MQHTTIGVDLARSVFEVGISESPGSVKIHRRLSRKRFSEFVATQPPATFVMEACGSAHYWGRTFRKHGHEAVLLPPMQVRPYVSRNKTDRTDVKGILEAFRNTDIRPVPVKTIAQHQLGALHRVRSGWMMTRTARINALRGLLRELGIFIPIGARNVIPRVAELIEDADSEIPFVLRDVFNDMCADIRHLESQIKNAERHLETLARETPMVERLRSVPGVGLLTATALVAFVGDVQRFPSGRHFASYLGLTPRERSSGSKRRLGRISKRGDTYIRMLLVHGARSVLQAAQSKATPDNLYLHGLKLRDLCGHNKATVAVANKMARIIWSVWRHDHDYRPRLRPAA